MKSFIYIVLSSFVFSCSTKSPISETLDNESVSRSITIEAPVNLPDAASNPDLVVRFEYLLPSTGTQAIVEARKTTTTAGEGGGPGTTNYYCTTSIRFEGASVKVSYLDASTNQIVAQFEKPIVLVTGLQSPTHQHSTCFPHNFPSINNLGGFEDSFLQTEDVSLSSNSTIRSFISQGLNIYPQIVRRNGIYVLEGVQVSINDSNRRFVIWDFRQQSNSLSEFERVAWSSYRID